MPNPIRVFDLASALFPRAPFTEFVGLCLGASASLLDVVALGTNRVDVIPVVRVMQRGVILAYFAHFIYLVAG